MAELAQNHCCSRRRAATASSTSPRIACGCPTATRCSSPSLKQASAEYAIVVIRLDDGTEGIAEAVCRPEFTGEDSRSLAYMVATFFKPLMVGMDPLHHLTILNKLDRIRDCRAAKSLIDIALWDLRGKLLGQPVWRLLGGGPRAAGAAHLGRAWQHARGAG